MSLDKNTFSVLNTHVSRRKTGVEDFIEKTYRLHVDLKISLDELKVLIEEYQIGLKAAGVPLASAIQSIVKEESIFYCCPYLGENIFEEGFSTALVDLFSPKVVQMLKVLKLAQKAEVMIDPHPKNFVFLDNQISYVDFYPPYSRKFNQIRLQVAKRDEVEIIQKNFSYFGGDYLAPHFCGDFLNIDKKFKTLFPAIYEMSKETGLYHKSYESFEAEALEIRNLEDLRLKKEIYLI